MKNTVLLSALIACIACAPPEPEPLTDSPACQKAFDYGCFQAEQDVCAGFEPALEAMEDKDNEFASCYIAAYEDCFEVFSQLSDCRDSG
jgi:hypothetical protein